MPFARHHVWMLLGVVGIGAGVVAFTHARSSSEFDEPAAVTDVSVRFHRALRTRATDIAEASWEEPAVGSQWAHDLLELDDGNPDVAVLPAFGAPASSVDDDRAHLLLAMVGSRAKTELPAEILLYEVERIRSEELASELAPLVDAARAYVFAEADQCERLTSPPDEVTLDDPLLDGIRALMIDGSLGCCAQRTGNLEQARDRIRQMARDAERLEVAVDRVPMLRAWVAFSLEDADTARAELDRVVVEHLGETDLMRYRMLRGAVTSGEDTLLSIVDPKWLSSLVIEGITEAIGRDTDLSARIEESATARAALRFVQMEAALIGHARDLHPLFDHQPLER